MKQQFQQLEEMGSQKQGSQFPRKTQIQRAGWSFQGGCGFGEGKLEEFRAGSSAGSQGSRKSPSKSLPAPR